MKLAAIDIGSNAVRLLIVRTVPPKEGGGYKKLEFIRVPLRLGDDVFGSGKIGKEKKTYFLMAMQAFKLIMDIHRVDQYMACATSAMREAKNGKQLCDQVARQFKFKINIISGDEESRLILQSVIGSMGKRGNFIQIDVGGGSTEITLVHNGVPRESGSFPVGTVRLLDGKVKAEVWKEMEQWVKKQSAGLRNIHAIGTGGNINKLYRMSGAHEAGAYMQLEQLEALYHRISKLSIPERIDQLRLNPDRADVIEPAAKIYLSIMKWGGIQEIISPQAGLKEGLILELLKSKEGKS